MEQGELLRRIIDFVDIPTDASDPRGQRDGADWLRARLVAAGFSTTLREGLGPPFVLGRLETTSEATLVVYMMYDTREPPTPKRKPSRIETLDSLGRCLLASRPIGNKAAIETFLTAVTELRRDEECPSLVVVAEGMEVVGSPGLGELIAGEPGFFSAATSVFWPRLSQMESGRARLNLGYRGMLGVTLKASGLAWGRGPQSAGVHSQYRPWVDAPTWRLLAALNSLTGDDGNDVQVALPSPPQPHPPPPATFDIQSLIAELGVAAPTSPPDSQRSWARLALPSVNLELLGNPGPGVGLIQPLAAVRLQFRLPPGIPMRAVVDALRIHLDEHGWFDITVDLDYALDGARTDDGSPVVRAARAMYKQNSVELDDWPLATSTSPTCAFAALGYAFADAGLGYQDERRNILALEDVGVRAGVERTVSGYRTFLTEFTAAAGQKDGEGLPRSRGTV